MDFFETIYRRHSVRSFLDKPVEEEKIIEILKAAQAAPSWQNRQCWRFIVVRDKEMIKRIALLRPFKKNINFFLKDAPAIVLVVANPKDSGHRAGLDYFLVDCAIAMEHLILAATALGLATCWIGAFDEDYLKTLLSIPKEARIVALTPLGYQKEKPTIFERAVKTFAQSKKRKPLSEIVYSERWGVKLFNDKT